MLKRQVQCGLTVGARLSGQSRSGHIVITACCGYARTGCLTAEGNSSALSCGFTWLVPECRISWVVDKSWKGSDFAKGCNCPCRAVPACLNASMKSIKKSLALQECSQRGCAELV